MATLLVTSKMDPALAARVEASVRGQRHKTVEGRAVRPRLVSLARFAVALVAIAVVASFLFARRRDHDELDRARASLLATVRAETAQVTSEDTTALVRVESWLVRASGAWDGELADDELRAEGGLTRALARPVVYVRGPIANFTTVPRIAEASSASSKDALLLCLVEPPPSRVEMVMLPKVRIAYGVGTTMEEHTPNIRRLHDAVTGLPFLMPSWTAKVSAARDVADLARLRRDLERAPLARAKQAARAEVLLFALDEPSDRVGPAELDGERAHTVRIGLVELASGRVLLRTRKLVDPSWISMAKKSEYASGLDGCGLAFDVREGLKK